MNLEQLELHDGNFLGLHVDPADRIVEARIAYYPDEHARERVLGTLRFEGVSHLHQITDLVQLENHAGAGNISQWITGETPGISYLYLARGLIAVTAASVALVSDSSEVICRD